MKLQSIGLVRIVFIIALCLYSSFSFAQCPPDYPVDCGDSWCCLQTDITDCVVLIDSGLCISVESNTTTTTPDDTTTTTVTDTTTISSGPKCLYEKIYGENSEEVEILRYIRDDLLSQTPEGRKIIRLYHQWSPVIVEAMEEDEEFKEEVKEMIDGILGLDEEVE